MIDIGDTYGSGGYDLCDECKEVKLVERIDGRLICEDCFCGDEVKS